MLHTGLYKEKEPSELPENVTAPSFSVSFKIEMDPAVAKERKRNLSVLVSKRNRLIHSDLATFDPDSVESCATLSAFLDEQNDRILKQLDSLKFLSDAVSELGKALGEFSESEEFLEMIRREVDGA